MSILRIGLPILGVIFMFGCAQTGPIAEDVLPEPEELLPTPFVTAPLPGVDSLVIDHVVETYDSTFVEATKEIKAQESYLEGEQLVAHAESILTVTIGPSVLQDSASVEEVDAGAFAESVQGAREVLVQAGRAQAAQDSAQVQSLLATAQQRLEEAVSLNPRHEESRLQLAQLYNIRANNFQEQGAWEEALELLRGLVALRANQHGLWSRIARILDNLERFPDAAVIWLRAAGTVLDDSILSFDDAAIDSSSVFTYSVRSYRSFVNARSGKGVHRALAQAQEYATSEDEYDFAKREQVWAQWDYLNLGNRLVFDSLRQVAAESPIEALEGFEELIPRLVRPAALWDANYNYAILSHQNNFEDRALDTLRTLWYTVAKTDSSARTPHVWEPDSLITEWLPYPNFEEDLRTNYSGVLFERALSHRRAGRSGLTFTYLMQVTETGSSYTGKAYIEALRSARYNPEQALELEPQVEAVFDEMEREDQLAYLQEIGNLYRRLGKNDETRTFLERYKAIRSQPSN